MFSLNSLSNYLDKKASPKSHYIGVTELKMHSMTIAVQTAVALRAPTSCGTMTVQGRLKIGEECNCVSRRSNRRYKNSSCSCHISLGCGPKRHIKSATSAVVRVARMNRRALATVAVVTPAALGGAGNDTYQFDGYWGKDTILDTDGQGSIQIDGVTLGKGIANGKGWAFDLGGGVYAGMAVYDDTSSATKKKLVITKGVKSVRSDYVYYKNRICSCGISLGCGPNRHINWANKTAGARYA
jgi:hypothetical protein